MGNDGCRLKVLEARSFLPHGISIHFHTRCTYHHVPTSNNGPIALPRGPQTTILITLVKFQSTLQPIDDTEHAIGQSAVVAISFESHEFEHFPTAKQHVMMYLRGNVAQL